jgi:CheY-like chemotaxis protein
MLGAGVIVGRSRLMPAPKRIVIADNDDEWLGLIALDLRLEGHEVVGTATCGDDALTACHELRPDVLVVDHRMPPGRTGLSVADTVRDDLPDIVVILFTNYEDPALIRAAGDAGARFVLKTNLRELRRAVSDG